MLPPGLHIYSLTVYKLLCSLSLAVRYIEAPSRVPYPHHNNSIARQHDQTCCLTRSAGRRILVLDCNCTVVNQRHAFSTKIGYRPCVGATIGDGKVDMVMIGITAFVTTAVIVKGTMLSMSASIATLYPTPNKCVCMVLCRITTAVFCLSQCLASRT